MIRDIRSKGGAIDAWGALLNIPQFIGGLIFIGSIEGKVILFAIVFTLVVAGQIHKRNPFSRLTGICHLPWIAMLPWLVSRLSQFEHSTALTTWLLYVVVVVLASLVFDVWDIVRYFRGDKKFDWAK